jgi:hypothetical protein
VRLVLSLAFSLFSREPAPRAEVPRAAPGLLSFRVDRAPESAIIPFDDGRRGPCVVICRERGKDRSETVVD